MKLSSLLDLFSNKKENIGGLDRISPRSLSGWLYSYKESYDEVHLICESKIIAKTGFNVYRNDVNEKLRIQGNHGFELFLNDIKIENLNNSSIKLYAVNNNSSNKYEIKLISNPSQTYSQILNLFKSNLLARDGHLDGIQDDGTLTGWAGKFYSKNPIEIWLQSKNLEPVKIFCDEWRDGMNKMNIQGFCGFSIDPFTFSNEWSEKEVYCSFDNLGNYKLPQNEAIFFPYISNINPYNESDKYFETYEESHLLSSKEIQTCWNNLKELSQLLDNRI